MSTLTRAFVVRDLALGNFTYCLTFLSPRLLLCALDSKLRRSLRALGTFPPEPVRLALGQHLSRLQLFLDVLLDQVQHVVL